MVFNRPSMKFPKLKKIRLFIIVILLLFCTAGYLVHDRNGAEDSVIISGQQQEDGQQAKEPVELETTSITEDKKKNETEEKTSASTEPEYIYVDVSGAVNTPMVVCIPFGSRVFEAIEAAGGRNQESSVKYLNLASVCEDGQKIYVPTVSEIEAAESSGGAVPGQDENSSSGGGKQDVTGNTGSSDTSSSGSKVNINTAGSEELQSLPGVGPAIASRIIDYRNTQGSFQSVEDIKSVSGIGEKIYEKLKDEICV